jgi:glutamyl-tRNA synthetase
MTVRVRFAPSPTGYLHIGAARSALFNWLFARKSGGKFLLRIEDTDLQRSTEESTRSIIDGLEWLGLDYDEELVFQSNNAPQHRAAANRLLEEGKAYRDFTPKEQRDDSQVKQEIAERARAQTLEGVDPRSNPFRDLSKEESDRRAAAGEPFAVRLKVPVAGQTKFDDVVFGPQEREHSEIEDLVLLRSDGHPLYNLSVVIDDIDMGITHVIRGQDHFLALLGWSPPGGKELLSKEELVEAFSLEGIGRANAIFNFQESDPRRWTDDKALWMNAEYIRTMPLDELLPLVKAELRANRLWREEYEDEDRDRFLKTIDLIRQRYFTLKDFSEQGRAYFSDDFDFDESAVNKNLRKEPRLRELLSGLADKLETVEPFNTETAEAGLRAFADEAGVKAGLLINGSRTMLTGQAVGPSMFDIFDVLGRDASVQRLRSGIPFQ